METVAEEEAPQEELEAAMETVGEEAVAEEAAPGQEVEVSGALVVQEGEVDMKKWRDEVTRDE